jgi:hypothetical protein
MNILSWGSMPFMGICIPIGCLKIKWMFSVGICNLIGYFITKWTYEHQMTHNGQMAHDVIDLVA